MGSDPLGNWLHEQRGPALRPLGCEPICRRYRSIAHLDNNTGGWGHINLDYIRYFSSDAGIRGDFNGNGEIDLEDIDLLTAAVGVRDESSGVRPDG